MRQYSTITTERVAGALLLGTMTIADLSAMLGLKYFTVEAAVRRLYARNQVKRARRRVHASMGPRPYVYWIKP